MNGIDRLSTTATASGEGRLWVGVELRHLSTFATVAEQRSFRAAARTLGYSQPAVSQHVTDLERMVGHRLLRRQSGASAIALTPAGRSLLAHIRPILTRFAAAKADLGAAPGVLRVGLSETYSRTLVPATLARVATERPELRVDVVPASSDAELAELVARCTVDVALGGPPPRRGPFAIRRLGSERHVVATPAGWDVARRATPVTVSELESLPGIGRGGDDHVGAELSRRGIHPNYVQRAASEQGALALVAAGLGVAIVPLPAVAAWEPRVVAVDLDGAVAPQPVVAYTNCDRCLRHEAQALIAAAAAAMAARTPEIAPVAVPAPAPRRLHAVA